MDSQKRMSTPEERELDAKKAELARLEEQFANLQLELRDLELCLSVFHLRYLRIVGARYLELDRLKKELLELKLIIDPNNKEILSMLKEILESLKQSEATFNEAQSALAKAEEEPAHVSEEAKKFYREACKLLHPDLEPDPEIRRKKEELMKELNRAYSMGDASAMQAILEEWQSSPEAVKGEGTAFELVRTIRKIHQTKRAIESIKKKIDELKASSLFQLYQKSLEAEKEGRDLLQEIAEEIDAEIEEVKKEVAYVRARAFGKSG